MATPETTGAASPATRDVLDALPDGALLVDAAGRLAQVNPAAVALLGMDAAGWAGQPAAQALLARPALLGGIVDGRPGEHEVAVEHPDGPRRLLVRVLPFEGSGRLVLLRDPGARAAAVGDALLEATLDGVVALDAEARIVGLNPSAEAILGLEATAVAGLPALALLFHEAEHPALSELLRTVEAHGVGRRLELPVRRADGETFPAEVAICALPAGAGPSFTVTVRDISERVQLEHMKDELLATVSHELRTRLTSLRGFAELLIERELPRERQTHFLGVIRDESTRLARLIDELLDLKTLERGAPAYRFQPLALGPLLDDAVTACAGVAGESHPIRLDTADDLPPVRADADRIRQAVDNLLANAVKFSPDGGAITVCARSYGELVMVSVQDEGIGIEPEDLPRLFHRFFRAEAASARQIGGTGLGLALVQQIVQDQDGQIDAESRPGHGSLFRFTLPRAPRGGRSLRIEKPDALD